MCWLIVRKIKLCHNDTFSHETFQKGCKHVLNTRNVFTKVQSYHTGSSVDYFVKDALYKQIYTQLEIRAFFSSTKNPNVITNVKSEMMVFYVRWYNSVGTPLEQCRDQGEVQAHVIFTFLKKQPLCHDFCTITWNVGIYFLFLVILTKKIRQIIQLVTNFTW